MAKLSHWERLVLETAADHGIWRPEEQVQLAVELDRTLVGQVAKLRDAWDGLLAVYATRPPFRWFRRFL